MALGRRCCLTDTTIDRLWNYEGVATYSSIFWEPAKYEINVLVSLFHVVSNEDSIVPLVRIVGANTMLVEPTYKHPDLLTWARSSKRHYL